MKNNDILFKEVQKFRQWWAWIIVVIVFVFSTVFYGYAMIQQFIFKIPFGPRPMSDTALLLEGTFLVVFGIVALWLFIATKLITEVHRDRVCLKFYPFQKDYICFTRDRIRNFEVCKYSPLREYGGWGIRKSKRGFAYNMRGNIGLELELSEGTKVMIGTQKPDEFKRAMEEMLSWK